MTLAALQRDLRDWLQTGSAAAAARLGAKAAPGLLVYQNNYRAALMACLEESFPRTRTWIGDAAFRAAAANHIDAVPPSSWSLDHYAACFPASLAACHPGEIGIAELAALEQALSDAFVGPDAAPLVAARLPYVDWDHAVLHMVPGARIIMVASNAAAIWSALAAGEEPPTAVRLPGLAALVIWRQGLVPCFRTLEPLEAAMIAKLAEGCSFAAICADLVATLGEAEGVAAAGAWLGRWVADEVLAAID